MISRKTNFNLLLAALLSSLFFLSCQKDDTNGNAQAYTTSGNANGSQENPPITSTATGTLSGTYNASTNVWNYSITWTGLSSAATLVELRGPASVGVNGSLVISLTITAPGVNGSASGSVTLSEQQEAYLLANQLYYNIVNATNVTGEIRGQIIASVQ
jgi:hypothetical protein